jgi:hypothetical protein
MCLVSASGRILSENDPGRSAAPRLAYMRGPAGGRLLLRHDIDDAIAQALEELGVHTLSPFRGQGLAAAVSAAWAVLPSLADRALFYSALTDNRSSHRVVERLALPRFGFGLRIY